MRKTLEGPSEIHYVNCVDMIEEDVEEVKANELFKDDAYYDCAKNIDFDESKKFHVCSRTSNENSCA